MSSFFDDEKSGNVVPLVTCENGVYNVDEKTLEWIEAQTLPFGVIACAGKYRTGKSFLMNRLAEAEPGSGFGVGDSVQACTKGLWLYKKLFEADGKNILIIDTEGIDALDANDTHDVRIFTLALLLCSSFLYNSVGTIDETAMQTLSLMTRVTENVRVNNVSESNSKSELAGHMPMFYWVLRDFSLKLVDKEGKPMTQQAYLEDALQTNDRAKSQVRDTIRDMFPNRQLVTLPRPSSDDGSIQNLERKLHGLTSRFSNAISKFRTSLFAETKPMYAQNAPMTGRMYATLVRHLVNVVQGDAVPVIRDSWSLIAAVQARDLKDGLISEFETAISVLTPKPRPKLEAEMASRMQVALDTFQTRSMKPVDMECSEMLAAALKKISAEAVKRLIADIDAHIERSLMQVEPLILQLPENMSKVLSDAQTSFMQEVDDDAEFVHVWRVTAAERALCRWIPRSLQALSSERDEILQKHETSLAEAKREMARMELERQQAIESSILENKELQQRVDLLQHDLQSERDTSAQLQQQVCTLQTDIQRNEQAMAAVQNAISSESTNTDADADADADSSTTIHKQEVYTQIETLTIRNAELTGSLEALTRQNKQSEEAITEYKRKIEQAKLVQNQLEQSWKQGLEDVKVGQKRRFDELQAEKEEKEVAHKKTVERLVQQIEEERSLVEDQKKNLQGLERKHAHTLDLHEKETTQLQTAIIKYREQLESAQGRVLEINRNMLEEMRLRDERTREQQAVFLRERTEAQSRVTELTSQLERERVIASDHKRRIHELELVEREHKCLKLAQQENSMHITRLEAENSHVREMERAKSAELERVRQENMGMEGELAVLRAEKQLHDAKNGLDHPQKANATL